MKKIKSDGNYLPQPIFGWSATWNRSFAFVLHFGTWELEPVVL